MHTVQFSDVVWSKEALSLPGGECYQLKHVSIERSPMFASNATRQYVLKHTFGARSICSLYITEEEQHAFSAFLQAVVSSKLHVTKRGS